MQRLYHYAFVGLVSLLAVIIAAFLLLFTDVSFKPAKEHLTDDSSAWSATKLRVSAELAYYKHWGDPGKDSQEAEKRESVPHLSAENGTVTTVRKLHRGRHGEALRNRSTTPRVPDQSSSFTPSLTVTTNSPKEIVSRQDASPKDAQNSTTPTRQKSQQIEYNNDRTSDVVSEPNDVNKLDSDTSTDAPATSLNSTKAVLENAMMEWESEDTVLEWEGEENIVDINMEEGYNHEEDIYADSDDINEIEEAQTITNALAGVLWIERLPTSPQNESVHVDNDIQDESGQKIKPSLMKKISDTHFHMPCPRVYKPVNEILKAPWMTPLLKILSSFEGNQVTLVIANNAYRDVLLNWLISAKLVSKPPLENIVVVSLDHDLYSLLQSKDIPSIQAPFSTVLNTKYRFRRFFELIMMMRLGFMRLINRLGYDCAMYDIDAIILKNPQPLYDKWADIDIIGSRGELPRHLWRRWGVAICIGAVFIRSNSKTGTYNCT